MLRLGWGFDNMIVLPGIILLRCVSAVVGVACLAVLQDTTKQSGGQYSTAHQDKYIIQPYYDIRQHIKPKTHHTKDNLNSIFF